MGTLAFAAACGSNDSGGTTEPTPTIGVSLGAPSVTVVAGQSGSSVVTLSRGGNYTGAINLAVEGAPAGVTATVAPASVPNGTTSATISLATTAATTPGTYVLTVRGTGTGVTAVTAPLSLVVTAVPSFTLTLNPTTLSIPQGGSGTTRVTLARTNFTGPIAATVTGLPAGVSAQVASITGDTATLTLTATAAATAGTSTVTVTGTGTGVSSQSAQLALTVTAAQPAQSIAIAVAPATVSVAQGGTAGTATVNVTRNGGFAGGVTLTASGAPAGLTVTPPSAPVADASGTLAISATSAVAAGTYPVTITAAGTGVASATTTLNVTVTPAVQVGGFSLAAPSAVTVQQGANATTTLTVTRTGGFAGGITVTQTGAPQGVTVTVTPNPVTNGTATVTVAAAANATTGNATITLTGASAGLPNATTSFAVNVTPGGSSGGNAVGYTFCAPEIPVWFAFQSDNGVWTRVQPSGANTYSFSIGARGGVAYVLQNGTSYDLTVIYGTPAELNTGGAGQCNAYPRGNKRLTGTVAGVGLADFVQVSLGPSSQFVVASTSFTLDSVPDIPLDLLASKSSFDLNTGAITPSKMILRRGVNYANGSAIPTLDFNGQEAFDPATANLTIANAGTDTAFVSTVFSSGRFSFESFGAGAFFFSFGASPLRYAGVPSSRLQAGDIHALFAFATARGDSTSSRGLITFVRAITDRSVTLGPAPSAVTVTSLGSTPYLRLRAQSPSQTQYNGGASVSYTQATRTATISATAAYTSGAPATWDLAIPDLSAAGFDATWGLRPATRTDWSFGTYGANFLTLFGATPTEGSTVQLATKTGTLASGQTLRFSRQSASSAATPAQRQALRRTAAVEQLQRSLRLVRR